MLTQASTGCSDCFVASLARNSVPARGLFARRSSGAHMALVVVANHRFDHNGQNAAIIGGVVYRGSSSAWNGK